MTQTRRYPGHKQLKKDSTYCFYTGVKMAKKGFAKRSIEHLLNRSYARQHSTYSDLMYKVPKVVCCTFVNELVGNAPLIVKYAIRDAFKSVTLFNVSDQSNFNRTVHSIVKRVFSNFNIKIDNVKPWDYRQKTLSAEKRENLKIHLKRLLSEEEKILLKL